MAKKFINWDNLEYIIESMQKFLIDHNGLDNHLDVFWEARERVTDNMKYGRDITGCTYTKEQYEHLINRETSPYLEGTFVGVAEKNKSQDGRLDDIEFGEHSKSDYDNLPYKSIVDINARDDEQDERMGIIEEGLSNRYTKKETDDEISEAIVGLENKLLGDDREQIVDTYETLKGIADWIGTHGSEYTGLVESISKVESDIVDLQKNIEKMESVDNINAKINDLRRVLDDIAHVEWDVNAWSESTEESTGEPTGEATGESTEGSTPPPAE